MRAKMCGVRRTDMGASFMPCMTSSMKSVRVTIRGYRELAAMCLGMTSSRNL